MLYVAIATIVKGIATFREIAGKERSADDRNREMVEGCPEVTRCGPEQC